MIDHRQYAPATVRRRDFILDVLRDVLPTTDGLSSKAARCKVDEVSLVANDNGYATMASDCNVELRNNMAFVSRFDSAYNGNLSSAARSAASARISVFSLAVWPCEPRFRLGVSTALVAEGTAGGWKEFTPVRGSRPLRGVAMPDNEISFSRRQIVGSAGVGLAAIAGTVPASAQDSTAAATPKPLEDPTKKYPRPPYNRQSQPWPGLASKMDPAPDHGEKSYRGSGRLAGRKALITGGDSGMGRAAAIAFAREGADVAINYLPSEEPDAREVVDLIRAAGRNAVPIPGDLRDASFCRRLVEDAVRQLGGLDILVSNAGRQQSRASIAEVSDEDFDATMKTNIYAPFYIIRAALPHLQPGSAIIATASEQAYDPSPDLYDYAQTKAATMNFVKSLAKQLGPKGIRVNGVAPGPIWTPLQISGGASEGKVVTFGATAPLGRAGQPAELAGIYVRLAEDDGSYTTGNIYGAGGGQGQP